MVDQLVKGISHFTFCHFSFLVCESISVGICGA